ncbi:MAG TPA: phosphatase PAP2 family protein [Candidatus Macondimonas sp.]|nr:phosphatase PAP2 family protein [Candidatus Macondimonas sp.]
MNRPLPVYPALCLGIILGVLFWCWPALDLWTARQFYLAPREFWWTDLPISLWQKRIVRIIGAGALLVFVIGLVRARAGRRWRGLPRRGWLYLLLALLVGPGLIVNLGLKEHWGRARPSYVEDFGGPQRYTPPLTPAQECDSNCGFVSGDAALGFFLMAGAFVDPRRRRAWLLAGIAAGGIIGFWRMAAGGHFLSDILFAGLVVYGTCALLAKAMRPAAALLDPDQAPAAPPRAHLP